MRGGWICAALGVLAGCGSAARLPVVPTSRQTLERLEIAWFMEGQRPAPGACADAPTADHCAEGAQLAALLDAYGHSAQADEVDRVLGTAAAQRAQGERAWLRGEEVALPPAETLNASSTLRAQWFAVRGTPDALPAAEAWTRASAADPLAWVALGLTWEAASEVEPDPRARMARAEQAWQRAVELDPQTRRARTGLAQVADFWDSPAALVGPAMPRPPAPVAARGRWALHRVGPTLRGTLTVDGPLLGRQALEQRLAPAIAGLVVERVRARTPGPGLVADVILTEGPDLLAPAVAAALASPGGPPVALVLNFEAGPLPAPQEGR